MRFWLGVALSVACTTTTPVTLSLAPVKATAQVATPTEDPALDARLAAIFRALDRDDFTEAARMAFVIACKNATPTQAELEKCPATTSPQVASAWVAIGRVAFLGHLEPGRYGENQLPLAEFAFERASHVTPSHASLALVLYMLAWTQYRRDDCAHALPTFVRTLDESTRHPTYDKLAPQSVAQFRFEAIEYAAICIADVDWDRDGHDDVASGFDRPEVRALVRTNASYWPDVYAQVVALTVSDVACPGARRALAALQTRFPNDRHTAGLTQAVASTCP